MVLKTTLEMMTHDMCFRSRSLRLQKDPNSSQTKLCWQAAKRQKSQEVHFHELESDLSQAQVEPVHAYLFRAIKMPVISSALNSYFIAQMHGLHLMMIIHHLKLFD
jgi:hypothetical protein